jgi:proteasome lid subunit RPN8/RPN11
MKIGKTIKVKPIDIKKVDFKTLEMPSFSPEGAYKINDNNSKHTYTFRHFRNRRLFHKGRNIPKFCTYISQQAWDDFMTTAMLAYNEKKHEACGVMIGKYFIDRHGTFAVATHFIQGTGVSTSASLCEISYEDNAYIAQVCQNLDALQVVWIHSHPGYGIFYSGQDEQTLRTKYNEDFHLGIVVDNRQMDYGAFKMFNKRMKRWDKVFLFHELCDDYFLPFKASDKILDKIDSENKRLALEEQEREENITKEVQDSVEFNIQEAEIIEDEVNINDIEEQEKKAPVIEVEYTVIEDSENENIAKGTKEIQNQEKVDEVVKPSISEENLGNLQEEIHNSINEADNGVITADTSQYRISSENKKKIDELTKKLNGLYILLGLMLVFLLVTIILAGGLIFIILSSLGN